MANRTVETNPTRKDAAPMAPQPVCPHCGADPVILSTTQFLFPNGLMGGVFFCDTCRKVLSIQATGNASIPRDMPRIVTPS